MNVDFRPPARRPGGHELQVNDERRDGDGQRRVLELTAVVRRVVAARASDPDVVDDLVQETLARVIEARPELDDGPLTAYAIVTARNVVNTHARTEQRRQRHIPRLVDPSEPETPEERALEREEREALGEALGRLSTEDRDAVVAHEVMDVDTTRLAQQLGSTPGGVAARLARTRAKLRVDYLIALQRSDPPTRRCRSVLIALSAGDRRRQRELNAGDHLLTCRHCAALSEPLMARRRRLAAWLPLPALQQLSVNLRRLLRMRPVQAGLVGAATVTAIALFLIQPSSCPDNRPALLAVDGGQEMSALSQSGLAAHGGERVRGCDLTVQSVPANEGFWVGKRGDRLWVQLEVKGESRLRVRPGQRITFSGRLVPHGPRFSQRAGVDAEGAHELRSDGYHAVVSENEVRLRQGLPK